MSFSFHTLSPTCTIQAYLGTPAVDNMVGAQLVYSGGIVLTCNLFDEVSFNSSTVNPFDNSQPHVCTVDWSITAPGVLTLSIDGNPVVQIGPATVVGPYDSLLIDVDPGGQSGFGQVAWFTGIEVTQP